MVSLTIPPGLGIMVTQIFTYIVIRTVTYIVIRTVTHLCPCSSALQPVGMVINYIECRKHPDRDEMPGLQCLHNGV